MEGGLPKKYLLIPIFYLLVVALFLFFHFTGGKSVNDIYGIIKISGKYRTSGGGRQALESLSLSWDNFHLNFSQSSTLNLTLSDGSKKEAKVTAYTLLPESLEIYFANYMTLRIKYSDSSSKSILISADSSENPLTVAAFDFPYNTTGGLSVEPSTTLPIIALKSSSSQALLSMPRGSGALKESGRIHINLLSGKADFSYTSITAASDVSGYSADPVVFWFTSQVEPMDDGKMKQAVESFLEASYRGWLTDRYRPQEGVWNNGQDVWEFSETTVSALLSEAAERGRYADVLAGLWAVQNLKRQSLTFQSAPFFGNLFTAAEKFQQEEPALINGIAEKIKNMDISSLSYPNILTTIVNRGPFSLSQNLFDFVRSLSGPNLNPETVLDAGAIYLDSMRLGMDAGDIGDFIVKNIETVLYPEIDFVGKSAFLFNQRGEADTLLNLKAALLFQELKKLETLQDREKIIYGLLGKRMLADILSYADERGFLPDTLIRDNGSLKASDKSIPPEHAYFMVAPNMYYPRETPLLQSYGPGAWVWSAAKVYGEQRDQNTLILNITFPVGNIHHLVIQGIRPFTELTMLDLPWRGDRFFQEYASGWFYREDIRTLFVKLRGKKETEQIIIRY